MQVVNGEICMPFKMGLVQPAVFWLVPRDPIVTKSNWTKVNICVRAEPTNAKHRAAIFFALSFVKHAACRDFFSQRLAK